jgi:hypothetical protein
LSFDKDVALGHDWNSWVVFRPNLRQLAKVYARLSSKTEDEAMATIADLLPYALALLAEFGSIVCFQHGFGRRSVSGMASADQRETGEETMPPTGQGRRRRARQRPETQKPTAQLIEFPGRVKEKSETLAFVLGEIGAGRSFPSQDHLATRVGVVKSTISKWLREWEGPGFIPPRARQGRCKVIGVSSS